MTEQRKQEITEVLKKHPEALASQGGGLVVWEEISLCYVFVLPPDWGNYRVGSAMPEEWGTGPACNALIS